MRPLAEIIEDAAGALEAVGMSDTAADLREFLPKTGMQVAEANKAQFDAGYRAGVDAGRRIHYGVMLEAYQRTRVRGFIAGASNWCASMAREIFNLTGPVTSAPPLDRIDTVEKLRNWRMPRQPGEGYQPIPLSRRPLPPPTQR